MPKKAQTRAAKGKTRARRPQPRAAQPAPAAVPMAAAETAAIPAASVAATRRSQARRLPTVTVDYAYLRHDLKLLAILDPAMIVLLFISYIVFHTA